MSLLRTRPSANAGYNLLEILIGMLIASISVLVVMQATYFFSERKRSIMGGSEAQNSGVIAFYTLQRDIRQSGYSTNAFPLLGCNAQMDMAAITLAPVAINSPAIPAGDANTDTIMVAFGDNEGSPEGELITQHVAGAATYTMSSAYSFSIGDRVIAELKSGCGGTLVLDKVSAVDTAASTVTVDTGSQASMTNGRLYNLGSGPKVLVYAIRGSNLTVCDYMVNDCSAGGSVNDPAVWQPMASNIVSLRAQYGRDTSNPMDAIVDIYDQTQPVNGCGWSRISVVRMVLVSRNAQPEKTQVTPATPSWSGSNGAPIDLSNTLAPNGFDWHNYRYEIFETVIPIRNIALSGVHTGC